MSERASHERPIVIVGAGLSGLIAAHAFPRAVVLEQNEEGTVNHQALLRFRSNEIAAMVGLKFRKVTVRKGVWSGNKFVAPNIQLANSYASKVTGRLSGDRSVWNLDPVERFIAPENLIAELVENVRPRIHWGITADLEGLAYEHASGRQKAVVSTAPLNVTINALKQKTMVWPELSGVKFESASINVRRFRIAGADVFQTIYFPSNATPVYRASITGDLLIVEAIDSTHGMASMDQVLQAFGIGIGDITTELESHTQSRGKIVPIPEGARRALLSRLTSSYGVYSLGRFACWRNILLDDLPQDIARIKALMRSDSYSHVLFSGGDS